MSELFHLDLFSGIGGFAIAAQANGFRTVAFCEIDPYAQAVLRKNFGAVMADAEPVRHSRGLQASPRAKRWGTTKPVLHGDIFTLDGTQYRGATLITGGFPCQPFSCAGKRRGKEDDRHLWPEMLRVIKESQPAWVLAENVPGIIGMELDSVLSDLEAIGYATGAMVIPACATDAKHRRDRVWIVGHANAVGYSGGLQEASRKSRWRTAKPGISNQDVTNPGRQGLQERRSTREGGREGTTALGSGRQSMRGATKSRLGGMVDGLPERLDSPSAWPDEDPETPRVAKGIENRVSRLKCLGNAIVPQVAFELIRYIALYEETLAPSTATVSPCNPEQGGRLHDSGQAIETKFER